MSKNLHVGILGAGLGSRLKSQTKAKPLAMLHGHSLLAHMVNRLTEYQVQSIHCALRQELFTEEDKRHLPAGPRYLFVNTESSLHTLVELIHFMGSQNSALFTMADTVLKKDDLKSFLDFCQTLPDGCCAVLVTAFVDDEKPLWVHLDRHSQVKKFSSEAATYVTSGLYFLTPQAMEIAKEVQSEGMHKMRNFLAHLTERKIPIKTFVVSKTIDVDHPSDLEKAADMLRSD